MSILEQKIIDTHHHLWDPASKKYDWLNKIQVVAAGEIDTNAALTYTLYEVIVSSND